jgi:hypothetical protein
MMHCDFRLQDDVAPDLIDFVGKPIGRRDMCQITAVYPRTVAPTIGGIREGRDEVMEAAVKYLRTQR